MNLDADACSTVKTAVRVVVIGPPGAGKTWFATRFARCRGLPVVHLDDLYWGPGWIPSSDSAWAREVEVAAAAPAWVIDGHFSATLTPRLRRAQLVIVVDPGPVRAGLGALRRHLKRARGHLDSLPAGIRASTEPTRGSFSILARQIWRYYRNRHSLLSDLRDEFGACPTIRVRRRADANVLIRVGSGS